MYFKILNKEYCIQRIPYFHIGFNKPTYEIKEMGVIQWALYLIFIVIIKWR